MSEVLLEEDVGQQIRMLRERCGMSMRQMAEKAGVTPAIISYIERGKNSPSIATLAKILRAADTDLQTFFGGNQAASEGPVYRRERMQSIADAERNFTTIFPLRIDIKLEMLDEHLFPDRPLSEFETLECDVAGYVLAGEIRLEIEDGQQWVVRTGDAFYVPKGTSHRGNAVGEEPAHLITACYPARY